MGRSDGSATWTTSAGEVDLDIVQVDLGNRLVPYREAWELQRRVHAGVVRGTRPDTLLLLEHEPVFTAGSRTEPGDLPRDGGSVVRVDRGGRITWHGPGQLVGYPILRLPHPLDVVAHVRAIESLLLTVCRQFGVTAVRRDGRSGVWLDDAERDLKIAAIGVRIARGVSMHGFALNCDCRLDWADRIIPCGIRDAGVTSLSAVSARRIDVLAAAAVLRAELSSDISRMSGAR